MANESKFSVANPQDPDAFQPGAPDKFIGVIGPVLAYPYAGKETKDHKHYGFVGVHITPDEDSGFEPFTRSYLGFYLNAGVPSKDGKTPAGATDEAFAALSAGKGSIDSPCLDESRPYDRHVIPSHPNVGPFVLGRFIKGGPWDQFCTAVKDSDTKGVIDQTNPRLDFCSGLRCRFDLIPEKSRKEKKEGDREQKILVVTEVLGVVDAKKGKGASASASASGANGAGGDLASAAKAAILAYLAANGGKAAKGTLVSKVSSELKKAGFDKAEAMAWIGDSQADNPKIAVNLVDIDGTEFDLDTQVLSLE